jgi:hypothetical protein
VFCLALPITHVNKCQHIVMSINKSYILMTSYLVPERRNHLVSDPLRVDHSDLLVSRL